MVGFHVFENRRGDDGGRYCGGFALDLFPIALAVEFDLAAVGEDHFVALLHEFRLLFGQGDRAVREVPFDESLCRLGQAARLNGAVVVGVGDGRNEEEEAGQKIL